MINEPYSGFFDNKFLDFILSYSIFAENVAVKIVGRYSDGGDHEVDP